MHTKNLTHQLKYSTLKDKEGLVSNLIEEVPLERNIGATTSSAEISLTQIRGRPLHIPVKPEISKSENYRKRK